MNRILKYRPSPATAIALAALVVAVGGVAYATIPDSSGTIHGCFNSSHGNLRVVESASQCRTNETAIEWNRQGPPGPPGPPGKEVNDLGQIVLADGDSRVVFSRGALTLTARCRLDVPEAPGGPLGDHALIAISTAQDNSTEFSILGQFNTTTPEGSRLVVRSVFAADTQGSNINERFAAAAPDGTTVSGKLWGGANILDRRDRCTFGGYLITGSAP